MEVLANAAKGSGKFDSVKVKGKATIVKMIS